MALNRRQLALYKHKIDVWSVTRVIGVDNNPGPEVYTRIVVDEPCLFEYTPNVDVETEAGRVKEFTLLTTDKIHMQASVPIADGCISVNKTTLSSGAKSVSWGEVHAILGAPNIHESLGERKANKLFVEGMSMEKAPAAIAAFYGLS